MGLRVERLTLDGLWDALAAAKTLHIQRDTYADLVAHTVSGDLWGAYVGSSIVAFGGVQRTLPGCAGYAGFNVTGDFAPHTVSGIRAMRRIVDAAHQRFPFCFALVRDDNPAGQRIARMVGFAPTEHVLMGAREWHTRGRADRIDSPETVQPRGSGAAQAGGAAG